MDSADAETRWIRADDEMLADIDAGWFAPLDVRESDNGTVSVLVYVHDIPVGSGSCWRCGLIPLDYDAQETPCVSRRGEV